MGKPRLIVGISGASGAIYGLTALRFLRDVGAETHLIVTRSAQITIAHELNMKTQELAALADVVYRNDDIGAAISSGSFLTTGMLIAPCSIRTLSEISSGITGSLISRAADVVLKERRKLVLLVRETPLHLGHLRQMVQVTEIGAVVMPPVPAFYAKPQSIQDIVDHTIGRALDAFGLHQALGLRWGENVSVGSAKDI